MKTQIRQIFLAGISLLVIAVSCSRKGADEKKPDEFSGAIIIEWNGIAYNAFGGPAYQHSLMASRINAMMHIAIHDAINAAQPVYETYTYKAKADNADVIAAAASAAHAVLLHEIPAKKNFLDSALTKALATVKEGEAKTKGIEAGRQSALSIIALRENDGASEDPLGKLAQSSVAGVYQTVPPFDFVFAPNWLRLKPFGLQHSSQFRSAPHPALNSSEYTRDFNEVKEVGKLNSATRKDDQTAYAKYWYEFSEAGWNRVAAIVAANKKLNLHDAARLFALVDIALADAYIAGWESKFHYNFWRPYTAIRRAAIDGNDATSADTSWVSSEPTPPIHDYPSTHSALGNAAATVLANVLGDNTSFTMTSPTGLPSANTRSFNSFKQAANENADSRVMAGLHFRFSCNAGQAMGDKVGNWITENYFRRINQKK
jgi:hypothetical protein